MQNFRMLGAIIAGAMLVSGAACAQTASYKGEARLATAAAAPREVLIAGVTWRCEGDRCAGSAERKANLDGLVRECKKVVAVVGPVSSFKSGARDLTDGQVRACNKGSAEVETAQK